MSKSDWKKIIESKIDDGWTDLDINHIAEFVGNEVVVEKLCGEVFKDCLTSKSSIVYDVVEPNISSKYRYKLKPLAPIQITEFEADILWRYAKDYGTPNTVKYYDVLTKFNGREVIIL